MSKQTDKDRDFYSVIKGKAKNNPHQRVCLEYKKDGLWISYGIMSLEKARSIALNLGYEYRIITL